MSNAMAFIHSLLVNSFFFIHEPTTSPVVMASGDMEGICLVLVGSCISNNLLIIFLMHKKNSISK